MPGEKREVKVVLDVGLGPQGDQALRQMESALNKAGAAYAHFREQGQVTAGGMGIGGSVTRPIVNGPVGGYGNNPGGGDSGGFSLPGLGKIAAIGAVISTARAVVNTTANSYYDPYVTNGQIGRSFLGALPYGKEIKDQIDTLTGRRFGLQMADVAGQMSGLDLATRNQITGFNLGYNPGQAGRAGLASAFAGQSPTTLGYIDRSNQAGRNEYDLAVRLLPVRREIARADRESAQAAAERRATEEEAAKIDRQALVARERRADLERRADNDQGSGEERQRILRDLENANTQVQALADLRRSAGEAVLQSRLREQQAIAGGSRARAAEGGARADYLENIADRANSAGENLGNMNPFDRAFAVQSAKALLQFGPDQLSPEMNSAARSLNIPEVNDVYRKAGLASPEFRELQKLFPGSLGSESPESMRRQAATLRDSAEGQSFYAEERFARAARDSGKDMGAFIAQIFVEQREAMKSEIVNQLRLGKNAQ